MPMTSLKSYLEQRSRNCADQSASLLPPKPQARTNRRSCTCRSRPQPSVSNSWKTLVTRSSLVAVSRACCSAADDAALDAGEGAGAGMRGAITGARETSVGKAARELSSGLLTCEALAARCRRRFGEPSRARLRSRVGRRSGDTELVCSQTPSQSCPMTVVMVLRAQRLPTRLPHGGGSTLAAATGAGEPFAGSTGVSLLSSSSCKSSVISALAASSCSCFDRSSR
mmetsp:Transcript_23097/g.57433  ORF Transcript_23097/g.57433 Transcript_23097/m.57433 type:complete len:226 (-) Transcript_23097:737-1414(-)